MIFGSKGKGIIVYFRIVKNTKLKEHLLQIAGNLTPESTLQDVYEQLSLLEDIEESHLQEEKGKVLTQAEVELKSREWLK